MRMMDFAIFVIFLQMCIGFVVSLGQSQGGQMGLFPNPDNVFLKGDQGGQVSQYQQNVTGDSGRDASYGMIPTGSGADIITLGIDFILAGFKTLIMIAGSFVAISWILYTQFHLDPRLCAFIQGIVYIVYLWGFLQWKSGRGGRAFE